MKCKKLNIINNVFNEIINTTYNGYKYIQKVYC